MKAIGRRVRLLRAKKGLNQKELAELVAICPETLCRIEKGKQKPAHKTGYDIAKVLGVDFDFLMDDSE